MNGTGLGLPRDGWALERGNEGVWGGVGSGSEKLGWVGQHKCCIGPMSACCR